MVSWVQLRFGTKWIFAGAAILLVTGMRCDDDPIVVSDEITRPNSSFDFPACEAKISESYEPIANAALSQIQDLLNQVMSPCPADSNLANGLCEYVSLRFSSKDGSAKSLGQRILVIDDGMYFAATTRYHSRVLDFVAFDQSGDLVPVRDIIHVPKIVQLVSRDILDEKFSNLPPCALAPIQREYSQKTEEALAATFREHGEHGDMIFTKLAELNPDAEFVLVHLPKTPKPNPCDFKENGDEFLARYSAFFDNVSTHLSKLLDEYQISFINMSFDNTVSRLMQNGDPGCDYKIKEDLAQSMMHILESKFYEPLLTKENVFTVQAISSNVDFRRQFNRDDHHIACTPFSNRIRVGVFGAHRNAYVSSARASSPCTDVFVDLWSTQDYWLYSENARAQIDPVKTPYFSYDGVNAFPVLAESTSWAAPIALSYLIFLKNNPEISFPQPHALLEKPLWDPISQKSFEIYRQGILQ